jgi:hypothetical protein
VGEIGGFPKSGSVLFDGNLGGDDFCGVGGGKDAFDSDKVPLRLICRLVFDIFAFLVNALVNELRSYSK